MFKQTTSTAARLRARTIYAPTARPLPLLTEPSKAQGTYREPELPLSDHDHVVTSQDRHNALPHMVTFSAFNPYASRPLLMSGLSLTAQDWSSSDTYPEVVLQDRKPNFAVQDAKPKPFKPWPYSLPKFMQPQPGTTYQLMYDSATMDKPGRIGILQALFYGVPDPEGAKEPEKVKEDGLVRKVMYGVKDDAE